MYLKKLERKRKGMVIDGIAATIIVMGILELVSWLLEITGNSLYILAGQIYAFILLTGIFGLIESHYGPIIIQFIYRAEYKAEYKKEKEEIEAFRELPLQYPP